MQILFDQRDFIPRSQPDIAWRVEELTWHAIGGPDTARLRTDFSARTLADPAQWFGRGLLDLLRCPLQVLDETGMPAWWGYVSRLEIVWQGVAVTWDLDQLANRVGVAFAHPAPPGPWSSRWQLTPWAGDAASQARFGVKERILHLPEAGLDEACALRDAVLAQQAWPKARVSTPAGAAGPHLLLTARGWQHSLDWITAPQTDGLVENTPAGGVVQPLGASAAVSALGQSFVFAQAGQYARIWLRVGRHGAPTDNLRVALHADQDGSPAPSALSSLLTPGPALPAAPGWELFSLPAAAFNANATGWIVVSRSGSPSATNYYEMSLDEGAYFSGGLVKLHNGSSWALRSPAADACFRVEAVAPAEQQLPRILALQSGQGGQFLAGVQVNAPAGVLQPVPQSGYITCGDALRAVLAANAALMAYVTPERVLQLGVRPAEPDRTIRLDGKLLNISGQPLRLHQQAAGHLAVFAPGLLDAPLAIERTVYTPAKGLRVVSP